MKYTPEERLDIGKRIYNNEITRFEASVEYGISEGTARDYMRLYRDTYNLAAKGSHEARTQFQTVERSFTPEYEKYEDMTKEELIRELVKARVNEARLKKGYYVKGDGAEKEYIPLDSKNTK